MKAVFREIKMVFLPHACERKERDTSAIRYLPLFSIDLGDNYRDTTISILYILPSDRVFVIYLRAPAKRR